MKKSAIHAFLAAAALLFCACSSDLTENGNENETAKASISATQELLTEDGKALAPSRTVLAPDNNNTTEWTKGDAIGIFDGTSMCKYTAINSGATCTFVSSNTRADEKSTHLVAVYPYNMANTISGSTVSKVTLPSSQVATENGFDPACNLMTASSTALNTTLQFKHVCSYIKVQPGFDCSRIVFTFNTDAQVAGTFDVTVGDDGTPSISNLSSASNTITLVGDITKGKTYYIAVLPGTYSNGFKVTLEQKVTKDCVDSVKKVVNTSVRYRETTNTLTSTRAQIKSLGTLDNSNTTQDDDFSVEYVDLGYGDDWNATSGTRVLWAKCNLGATKETDGGNFYAWGEVSPKDTYTSQNYLCNDYYPVTLDDTHDATTVNLGHGWRTPTAEDYITMKHNTIWVFSNSSHVLYIYPSGTTANGITVEDYMLKTPENTLKRYIDGPNGEKGAIQVTNEDIINYVKNLSPGNNNTYMCIPAVGHKIETVSGGCVRTWMNTRNVTGDASKANYLGVWNGGINIPSDSFDRYCGMPIRPVITIKW